MTWHDCQNCGASYRSMEAALRCCSELFEDDPDGDLAAEAVDEHGTPAIVVGESSTVETWGVV